MTLWPRSLQTQLAVRLAFVALIVTAAGIGIVLWQGSTAANDFPRIKLKAQAAELARLVTIDAHGNPQLRLPDKLLHRYRPEAASHLYVMRFPTGQVLASRQDFAALVARWPAATVKPRFTTLEDFGPASNDYSAMTIQADSKAGPVAITVARVFDADEIGDAIISDFVHKVAWLVPLFAAVTFVLGMWSIRRSLSAVKAAARKASEIDPATTGVRLPTKGLPVELVPFVSAVNSAFDRLENGYLMQRQFTANAAHELRTPLTILIAGLEELGESPAVTKLRDDAARMNRLVEQLLSVARHDAKRGRPTELVELNKLAEDTVSYLAPWVIAQGRSIGLDAAARAVFVNGDRAAIADALRNLIENAVNHTPQSTEVRVAVEAGGRLVVEDRGPGIPVQDRPHVFERFWRGRNSKAAGAGLGLAIVAEVARAHGAKVEIGEAAGGGATVALVFTKA